MTKKKGSAKIINIALRWFYRLLVAAMILIAAYIGFEAFITVYSNTHQVEQS
ncbi:hypothetical protein [Pseudoalteromonas denitrificans]|uniref:Uncharacterized protein n=1 Tax=Pseudoalteromonas denitrificans DSM 6059 TaxID=1123010 RepID=A0A1I1SJN5_9GAMM|nr:hypothetical protein [Pseudoalteromonas denitrificans]SFD46684.1 hypothetical protein SAMN02745724_04601 [Pseudoalteromonas denitrificans DSM 6059]